MVQPRPVPAVLNAQSEPFARGGRLNGKGKGISDQPASGGVLFFR